MISNWYLQSCPIAATPIRTRERRRSRAMRPPKHNPTKPHCFLTQCLINPEASHINVSEETPYTWRPCQCACAQPTTGIARARWDKDIPASQTLHKPRRRWANCVPTHGSRLRPVATEPGLKPRISGGTASTAMQCLRPLRHSGGRGLHHS